MTTQHSTPALVEIGDNDDLSSMDGLSLSSKSNALSKKITSVLSASYADSEIRNALNLLDARGTTNTTETRLNLRLDAQKEIIDCNVAILEEFGQVAEQLKRVGAIITTLNNTCDQMRKHIASAKSDSAPMLDEASTLIASKRENETKCAVLHAFTTHFVVADADLDILTSSAVPVDDQFFIVLSRVKKIHDDCEPLLGSENERLGLELMEQTSRNLDAGFKKLYTWVQRALKGLDLEDPQISGSIRRALRVLSERPTLFQNCLEFLADAREQTLSEAFQMALCGAGDGSGASAIEFSAHDLLRYMGDMLAWVHSTTVSEKESLEGLFIADEEAISQGMKLGKASEPWLQDFGRDANSIPSDGSEDQDSPFDGETALKDLVSRSLSTISTTLRERIELALHQHEDAILLFKAQSLLTFYHDLFSKLVGQTSTLTATVQRLETTAQDHLARVLVSDNDRAWASDPVEGPARQKQNIATLEALFAIKAPSEMPPAQLERLLEHFLGPAREFASRVAQDQDADTEYTDEDFMLAIALVSENTSLLSKYQPQNEDNASNTILTLYTSPHIPRILNSTLATHVHAHMLRASGVEGLTQETVDEALLAKLPEYAAQLDEFLADGYAEISGKFTGLDDGEKKDLVGQAREWFLRDLEIVFQRLEGLGEQGQEVYPRTMEDVRVLLG